MMIFECKTMFVFNYWFCLKQSMDCRRMFGQNIHTKYPKQQIENADLKRSEFEPCFYFIVHMLISFFWEILLFYTLKWFESMFISNTK